MMKKIIVINFFIVNFINGNWVWECNEILNSCQRKFSNNNNNKENFNADFSLSTTTTAVYPNVEICRMVCDNSGNLWPIPLNFEKFDDNKKIIHIDPTLITFSEIPYIDELKSFFDNFELKFRMEFAKNNQSLKFTVNNNNNNNTTMYSMVINLIALSNSTKLNWNTKEKYEFWTKTNDTTKTVKITIKAPNIYGIRHGMETLSQLIKSYKNIDKKLNFVTLKKVHIQDQPQYKHRGLLIDSSRNYLSINTIKKIIIAMSLSKMNILHWHLTDSQSFPLILPNLPNMTIYGAYSEETIYTSNNIKELKEFAKFNGIRIIPEVDGPAHAGNGWQWGKEANLGNLILCYNLQPYRDYCIQPPCGQMNPANSNLYKILKVLYQDILTMWNDENINDIFHMGGDEVFIPCWNASEEILSYLNITNNDERTEEIFLKLWAEFQEKVLKIYDNLMGNNKSSIILWTSTLTNPEYIEKYLSKERYIIQTWVPKSDPLPDQLINLGYKLIISTKDSWYLDHGFWGTTQYYRWQKVYDNQIGNNSAILGGEVCMWGELADDRNIEAKIWPRAAAAAERLWSNPISNATAASARFFSHINRLINYGINTASVVPEFCAENNLDCSGYLP